MPLPNKTCRDVAGERKEERRSDTDERNTQWSIHIVQHAHAHTHTHTHTLTLTHTLAIIYTMASENS